MRRARWPEAQVRQCWRVSPGPDFVLVVGSPTAGYQALSQRLLTQDANVRNIKAFFSVKQAKFERGWTCRVCEAHVSPSRGDRPRRRLPAEQSSAARLESTMSARLSKIPGCLGRVRRAMAPGARCQLCSPTLAARR